MNAVEIVVVLHRLGNRVSAQMRILTLMKKYAQTFVKELWVRQIVVMQLEVLPVVTDAPITIQIILHAEHVRVPMLRYGMGYVTRVKVPEK